MLYLFDDFELSEQEFSLCRSGKRIAIEPRALSVLLVLVQQHGKLLSKSFLFETVWQDTFVEDTTLTRIIAVLRKALEDDSRAPKYIETVPTRGYRFIAAVKEQSPAVAVAEPKPVAAVPEIPVETLPSLLAEEPQTSVSSATPVSGPNRRNALLYGGFAAVCVVMLAFFAVRAKKLHSPPLSTKDTLVLTDFSNSSGDPVFDDALRQGMLVQLEQSPVVKLASDGQLRRTLKLMGLQLNAPVTPEVGREVCQRIGGSVVLNGSISKLGNEYLLALRARRCSTGEELDAEQVQVSRKEDVLNALSQIATRFRTRLGEARASIEDFDTPLAEATTTSLDALKSFSQATRTFNSRGSGAALPLFQRAAELDPQFAMAHVWLGRMYADLGNESFAKESTQRAYTLRERASDRERYLIDVSYDSVVTGNLEKARSTCEAWIQMYPRDPYPKSFLSGVILPAYGQYERAVDEARATIAIDPDFVIGYRNSALNLIALNRVAEAEATLQQATQRKLFLPSFVTDAYRLAFLKGDVAGMKRAADTAPTNPWLLSYQAATAARSGHMKQARSLDEQALQVARHGSREEMEAQLTVVEAFTEALYGYPENASRMVRAATQLSQSRDVEYTSALILAMTGKTAEAEKQVNDLQRRFPEDTLVRYNYAPTIRAALALGRKQPQQAIELLKESSQFDLGQPLHSVYIRGQAFLALGQAPQASTEFRKITDHPGLVLNDPLQNLALMNLARSDTRSGAHTEGAATYDVLLQRWKDADSDLPVFQQAKKERSLIN